MTRHFGPIFACTFGSALVHCIYSADSRQLSVRAAFPSLWAMEYRGFGSLRRSARVGRLPARYSHSATAGTTPSHFPLSASNKRKRTYSTSKERSTGRASKRSHIIQADTPTTKYSPHADRNNTSSASARSQRYQRRHPSVFNVAVSETDTSQAIASTSYLPPLVVNSPIDSTQRRTRRKENFLGERIITGSRGSTWDSVKRPADTSPSVHTPRTSTLKGKERNPGPSSVAYDNASLSSCPNFSMGKSNQVADDDSPEPLRSKLTPPPQKTTELPVSIGADNEATQSVMKSQSPSPLRRLRSLAQTTAKASLTKRTRASSTGVPTGKKKPDVVEIEGDIQDEEDSDASTPSEDVEAVTTIPSEPTIPKAATLPYPMSLPNPIPTLTVTPPYPAKLTSSGIHLRPHPVQSLFCSFYRRSKKASQNIGWNWPTGTQLVVPVKSCAWEDALSSAQSEASSSPDDAQRGRKAIRSPRARRPRQKPRQVARVTERPSETLLTLACRERSLKSIANRRYYYMEQLKDYEADQAFQFFTRVSASPRFDSSGVSSFTSDASVVAPSRPQSPTWSIALHWEVRLQDAGEWDGHIHAMHPVSLLTSSSVLPPSILESRNANQDVSDRELDFRTEDCFPFELAESDEEEEEHAEQPSLSDPPSDLEPSTGANIEEEHEDTENDETDESEDPSSVHASTAVLRAEILRKLGSIGHGTPINPNRRRNLIVWLEDLKAVNNAHAISEKVFVQHGPERLRPVGSSAWYAMHFPSTLSSQPVLKSTAVKPDAFITSTGPTASSPPALLAGAQQQQLEAQTLTVHLTLVPPNSIAIKKEAYVGWTGMASASSLAQFNVSDLTEKGLETIEIDPQYSQSLGFAHGDIVEIGLLHDMAFAKSVATEPLTSDDWEIIEIHASHVESSLLSLKSA
ncbi:uncharacterized protein C8R40DRAFT_1172744 [Lentinula edodes]|uniref:uncharacterized protein n=1 Tax=Lentinula edodes TaxID=5353 RepID=UPI001E8DCDFE|nr:uncharacterized protein C8R40DRAFT_1172744 [Lentinula edodes]KAH7873100.1 hypothetical protein C8R40DRAFT_1172744 [Lentinula edodes]